MRAVRLRSRRLRAGVTLIELMVSSALAGMMVVALLGVVSSLSIHARLLKERYPDRDWQNRLKEQLYCDFLHAREWRSTPERLTLTLDAPAEAPMDLSAIRDTWRGEAPELAAALDQPAVQPSTLVSRPFADPLFWAPFMLVGRA